MNHRQFTNRQVLGASATLILIACAVAPGDPPTSSEGTAVPSVESNSKSGPELVSVRDEPPGSHCAVGGVAVLSGRDNNSNGNLDRAEVTATRYVCSGSPGAPGADGTPGVPGTDGAPGTDGLSTLITVQTLLSSSSCAYGGQAISWGLDTSRNGILDLGEVTGTTFICNGAPGAAAAPPLVTLTREPAGIHCATAGQRIDTGVDENRDGLLQAGEVASTGYVCNGADATALALTKITPIPINDVTCPYGGSYVEAGLDASGDGALQTNEIAVSIAVCTLRAATPIPPGSVCPSGGTHYDYGPDANQDGRLDSSEIQTHEDVCTAPTCGQDGQACCTTTPACSNAYAECHEGTCRPCGATGDVCCATRTPCAGAPQTGCSSDNICRMCGIPGGPCCQTPLCTNGPNPSCGAPGFPYRCVGNTCVQCGLRGLPCCDVMARLCGIERCTDGSSCVNQVTCQ